MILADENIDHSIIAYLREANIDVFAIYEQKRGISDLDIVQKEVFQTLILCNYHAVHLVLF